MNYRLLTIVTIIRVTTLLTNMLMKMYKSEYQDAFIIRFIYLYRTSHDNNHMFIAIVTIENEIKPIVVNVPSIHGSHNKLNIRQCI